jgi:hypothetical protein
MMRSEVAMTANITLHSCGMQYHACKIWGSHSDITFSGPEQSWTALHWGWRHYDPS